MVYSRDAIAQEIERVRGLKRNRVVPVAEEDVMPFTLGTELFDQSLRFKNLDNIDNQGLDKTQLVNIKRGNEQARLAYEAAQKEQERSYEALAAAQALRPTYNGPNIQGGNVNIDFPDTSTNYGNYTGKRNFGKRWGADNTPEVSDLGANINPNAQIVGVNYRGRDFQVNRQVAPIFVAFLDDLWKAGYRPAVIGGHNDRNIAGTNRPSLHSYGLAIDIDPGLNPVQRNGQNRNALPKNVAALAAKYGLSWGGNWSSYKDPMHFSVPYGGTE